MREGIDFIGSGDTELVRLLTFPNVLITAHQAFLTEEALAEIARVGSSSAIDVVSLSNSLTSSNPKT